MKDAQEDLLKTQVETVSDKLLIAKDMETLGNVSSVSDHSF